MGNSIPMDCQYWANTKAAYRFFSNPNLSETEILEGRFQSTKSRFDATDGPILVLHDATEITYKRLKPQSIGYTRKCANRKGLFDQDIKRAQCGVLMHSSLVLTPEGLPLGFCLPNPLIGPGSVLGSQTNSFNVSSIDLLLSILSVSALARFSKDSVFLAFAVRLSTTH